MPTVMVLAGESLQTPVSTARGAGTTVCNMNAA